MPIFFCNIAWMKEYKGPEDNMKTGGSWVEENNDGLEKYNFYEFNENYRGYVATQGHQIRIERLGAKKRADFIDDVLVVWVAKHPDSGGSKIVGWYKNARVYRDYQRSRGRVHNITAKVEDGVLLSVDKRVKDVPRANVAGKGRGMGQSNYWYADSPEAQDYILEVEEYIANYDREEGSKNDKKAKSLKKRVGYRKVSSNMKQDEHKVNKDFNPYPHQKDSWNALDKQFIEQDRKRGMIVVPTGGGKTTIASRWLIQNYIDEGYRILWLAHRIELLEQAYVTFLDFAHLSSSLTTNNMIKISSGNYSWSNVDKKHKVIFSTDRSAAMNISYLQLMAEQAKEGLIIVIDEAHHSVANGYQDIIKTSFEFSDKKDIQLLGLTATPMRMNPDETEILWRIYDDSYDLYNLRAKVGETNSYNSKIYEVSQNRLIEQNILSEPIPSTVKTNINFEEDFNEKDYKHLEQFGDLGVHILNKMKNSATRNKKIVQHYKNNRDKFGKTLVFAVDTLHCKTLKKEFLDQDLKADYVAAIRSSQENEEVINKYKKGSLDILISISKLTEGFDAPETQTVFLTRPTRSEPLLRQMIGRGLRGLKAGGTQKAYLVTFVDTWKLFKPIGADYIIEASDKVGELESRSSERGELVPVSDELIMSAYNLLQQSSNAQITGVYQALPHCWYEWIEVTEEGESIENYIIIFDNQYEAYEELKEYYQANLEEIPEILNKKIVKKIMYDFFGDCPDPLPELADIIQLSGAIRQGIKINQFTFEEKNEFNPVKLAKEFKELNPAQVSEELRKIYNEHQTCRQVYRNDFRAFYDEVREEIDNLIVPPRPKVAAVSEVESKLKDLRRWSGVGYNLDEIAKRVIYHENGELNKNHFPKGEPLAYKINFTNKIIKSYFGICRYSDKTIKINKILNSPDIPLYVMEFLLYHELLHVDMPNNGHDSSYRARERRFRPSNKALEDAKERGFEYSERVNDFWATVSNQFLDTLSYNYDIESDK
ncbi:DEAD/DEAH box helicase [Natroniella acetigena]|uniref:DEAD/DEAH box helicase n=1 Tax=Natroniella acetigena TaxID=52004 RepID=UPI00200B1DDC|nr:DEAD/DEAH box helicase [Natroniella acetigena]MCK8828252.1 DEAD/DEAH box helicase [Natroniella acetigena]